MVVYQRNTSSPPESQVIAAQSIKRTRASLIAAPPPFDKLRSTTKKCAPLVYPCRRDWTAASHLESSQFPNHMQGPPLPAIIRVMAAKKPRKFKQQAMAPKGLLKPRQRLSKDRFPEYFEKLTAQTYDHASRGSNIGTIRTIAWNPTGSLVATGSSDKTLRVWHQGGIEKIAFNPVKDAELCSVSNDGVVKFWDVRTKTCINEVKGLGAAITVVWAPDGESLIVGNSADNLYVLSPREPTPRASFQQPLQTNQISFCWSGQRIFAATGDGRTRILSFPDFEPAYRVNHPVSEGETSEFRLAGHTSACLTAELSPTGRILATGGSDSMIALWDTSDWICHKTVGKMTGPVRSIRVGIEVTHAESGEHVHTIKTIGSCPVVAWAPNRYCLAYSDANTLRIIGVDAENLLRKN
ncbi:WD repeat-containing protein [Pyricularia oryzae Y34]|uniref:WD repeat-containing protein n=2 Tax=Pyricularia oryzae TaxID=318829 RepID=A0AA97NWW4_PYRO3|nr:WD repeat-containing protein [Pyricularia oryzae Y34]